MELEDKKTLFLDALRAVMVGRRLFVTEKGYLGAGPKSSKVGDKVVVLKGGSVPFVVREGDAQEGEGKGEGAGEGGSEEKRMEESVSGVKTKGWSAKFGKARKKEKEEGEVEVKSYRFVGECYVHGVMRGEALKWRGFRWAEMELV
jgi:hypothetical protein